MYIGRKPPPGGVWNDGSVATRQFYHGNKLDFTEIQRMKGLIRNLRARNLRALTNRGPIVPPDEYNPDTDMFLMEVGLIRRCHDGTDIIEPTPFGKYDNGLLANSEQADHRLWRIREEWKMDKKQFRRSGRHHRSGSAHHVPVSHVAYQS